jgi:lipopolysaccharide/colanic/teichoic acid biosynthesis glycosyltransferase
MLSGLAKRSLDVALAGMGLAVTAPLMAVLAAAVKLDSPGPALFVQHRIGRGRRPIRVVKLRTMTADAATRGPQVTAARDPRVTRVGAVLRKTKLDELPQLWNVLRGDMSLVGPRPEVERYVARYRPEWQRVFDVRPGITDLASLTFRDEERLLAMARDRERAYIEVLMPLKLQLALTGVAQSSVLADLSIIMKTALSVVRPSKNDPVLDEASRRIEQLNRGEL